MWRGSGSSYVGRVARRAILGVDGKVVAGANGRVVGWLPSFEADYYSSRYESEAPLT